MYEVINFNCKVLMSIILALTLVNMLTFTEDTFNAFMIIGFCIIVTITLALTLRSRLESGHSLKYIPSRKCSLYTHVHIRKIINSGS